MNADLLGTSLACDSQSMMKSRQGDGISINQWDAKNQSKIDKYKPEGDSPQIGGLVGISLATYHKGHNLLDTLKTEKSPVE